MQAPKEEASGGEHACARPHAARFFPFCARKVLVHFSHPAWQPLVLSKALALRSLTTIRSIWQRHASGELVLPVDVTLQGSCVTVRAGKAGKMLFVELLDGSTVRTLQCICDSTPDAVEGAAAPDPRLAIDWKPLFDHCHRGATVTLTGTLVSSPAAGQPIEMVVQSFKCMGGRLVLGQGGEGQPPKLTRCHLQATARLRTLERIL